MLGTAFTHCEAWQDSDKQLTLIYFLFPFFFLSFVFLGPHPQRMEVPRLGVKSERYLPAYTTATATATWDPSHICNLVPYLTTMPDPH